MAITKYGVYTASFRLLKELQRKPTRSEVHEALGGGGSRGTIQKFMKAWEEEHASTIAATGSEAGAGSPLPDPLMALVLSIHERACAGAAEIAAEGVAAGEKRAVEAESAVIQAQAQLADARAQAAQEVEVIQAKLEAATEERTRLFGRFASLEDDVATWKDQAKSHHDQATNLAAENRTLHGKITALGEELSRAVQDRSAAEVSRQSSIDEARRHEQEAIAMTAELDALRKGNATVERKHQAEISALREEVTALLRRNQQLSAHAEALELHISDSC
ncbi:DNA-binding protein [Marinimicrobium sp. ABcell2]|uniref:DNA-binding protein n=1 Tax=Marinimicrobium sp. ABcell2 TaxID=3069751 RepID=UPI0027ADC18B|nr:DNA-binding protein [Marinimicrobium sp. ABcell2]MDQ2077381.1 DNA-binding protein [Marinimicrobium sp. ABcell2]